mgnify:FL=1
MEIVKAKARKWGNSIGLVIPRDVVKKENIHPGKYVEILIPKKNNVLKETFGTFKFKKTAQQIKDELRKELYD